MGKVIRQTTKVGEKLKEILEVGSLESKVGWFEGAKYQDGTPVAYVATIQEFGSVKNNTPPRSFMRTTVSEKLGEWADLVKSGAKAIIAGNASAKNVMTGLGLAAEGDVRKKIASIQNPALDPGTIKARQRKLANGKKVGNLDKPLIESALMINSLTSTVDKK